MKLETLIDALIDYGYVNIRQHGKGIGEKLIDGKDITKVELRRELKLSMTEIHGRKYVLVEVDR